MKEVKQEKAKKQGTPWQLHVKRAAASVAFIAMAALAHKGLIAYIGSGRQGVVVYATGAIAFLIYTVIGIYL